MTTPGFELPEPIPEQQQFAADARDLFFTAIDKLAPNADWMSGQPFGLVEIQMNHARYHDGAPNPQGLHLSCLPAAERFLTPMKDWTDERRASRVVPHWPGAVQLGKHVDLSGLGVDKSLEVSASYTRKQNQELKTVHSLHAQKGEDIGMFGEAVELVGLLKDYVLRLDPFTERDREVAYDIDGKRILTNHRAALALSPEVRITNMLPDWYLTALVLQLREDREQLTDHIDQIIDGRDEAGGIEEFEAAFSVVSNERTLVKDSLEKAVAACLKRGMKV